MNHPEQSGATPRLSSVQRFALKEILLGTEVRYERKYRRTRESLFHKGLMTSPDCGALTDAGRVIAKQVLQAEISRRAAIARTAGEQS